MAGFTDLFGDFTKSDVGSLMSGGGALANAWGNYTNNKKQNKLLTAQFDYEKQKDTLANSRFTNDRIAVNEAFGIKDPAFKKRKNPDGTDMADPYVLDQFNGK